MQSSAGGKRRSVGIEILNTNILNQPFPAKMLNQQQFPSACESVENGVFFGERFVEDSGAKLSWST